MKKVISVSIGRTGFNLEEDAYNKLKSYLNKFEQAITDKDSVREVMEDVEARIAEIFREQIRSSNQVVGVELVDKVILVLGTLDSQAGAEEKENTQAFSSAQERARKRFYRNPEGLMLGGVCGGLAAYFDLDPVLVRIIFACSIFLGGVGFFVYMVLWIAAPKATTIAERLEMRGEPVTAENIRNYTPR